MKIIIPTFLTFLLVALFSCSWVNNFYVANASSKNITLDFTLMDTVDGFGIFYTFKNQTTAYALSNGNKPDYEKPIDVLKESLGKNTHFRVVLPKNTALQIGALFNDKYTSHKQTFINGRVFNLKSIKVIQEKGAMNIFPDDFDANLKNESGNFIYTITN